MIYVFDQCTFDSQLRTLHCQGEAVGLRPQVFQVLLYLIEHRDRVISKQELVENVWPGEFITDAAVESCIRRVRQATGDDGRNQRILRTLHGHGYRFVADIELRHEADSAPTACIACKPLNPPEAIYCADCGAPLAKACDICAHMTRLPASFCAMCGRTLELTLPASSPIAPSINADVAPPPSAIAEPSKIEEAIGEPDF